MVDDAALRAEVESLLAAAEQAGDFLARPAVASATAAAIGQQLGPYRLLRELGSGGMGVVYLAERVDGQYRQQVAVKLSRLGLDATQQRFQTERQILAQLQHANIARLIDGGTTSDGRLYLVMEYLAGDKAQRMYAEQNHEYPVNPKVSRSALVESWGDFKQDTTALADIAQHRTTAAKMVDQIGYDF